MCGLTPLGFSACEIEGSQASALQTSHEASLGRCVSNVWESPWHMVGSELLVSTTTIIIITNILMTWASAESE